MDKQTAFLIWLYDQQLIHLEENNHSEAYVIGLIREKYAEFFGINEKIQEASDGV